MKGKLPPLGKSARETLAQMLGFSDDIVEKTGMLNGKGISARQRLFEMLHGLRPTTPREFLATLEFCWDRGIGTPVKAPLDTVSRNQVIFIGKPWDSEHPTNRALDARSAALNKAKDEEIRLLALEKANPTVIDVKGEAEPQADEGEGLERVVPPPADDPSAYR